MQNNFLFANSHNGSLRRYAAATSWLSDALFYFMQVNKIFTAWIKAWLQASKFLSLVMICFALNCNYSNLRYYKQLQENIQDFIFLRWN